MTILFDTIVAVAFVVVIVAVALAVLFARYWLQSDCEKETQEADEPCESCLRWSECNGVDEQCPHRKENAQNEQD